MLNQYAFMRGVNIVMETCKHNVVCKVIDSDR